MWNAAKAERREREAWWHQWGGLVGVDGSAIEKGVHRSLHVLKRRDSGKLKDSSRCM